MQGPFCVIAKLFDSRIAALRHACLNENQKSKGFNRIMKGIISSAEPS